MPGMGEVERRRVAQSGGRQIGGVKGRSRHYVMRPLGGARLGVECGRDLTARWRSGSRYVLRQIENGVD